MNEDQLKLQYLIERLSINEITREEFDELFTLINSGRQEENVKAVLLEGLENEQLPGTIEQDRLDTVLRGILSSAPTSERFEAETPVIPLYRRTFLRVAAAAAIILLIGSVVYLYYMRAAKNEPVIAEKEQRTPHDVAPGGNKAILTLADNSTIVLDSAAIGKLAQQGSSVVNKTKDGELKYESAMGHPQSTVIAYNMLSTPRGGQYQLELPDGSKVWLNAASSIRYPTAFTGDERSVDITGEAYFEVSKNVKKPFRVHFISAGREGAVEVLGTHFNVNAYDDEAAIKTTLLEGKVKVTKAAAAVILKPGEQTSISQSSHPSQPIPVHTDEVVAWKNGLFNFKGENIKTVMQQLGRWYDVEVVYEGDIKEEFFTKFKRDTEFADVLKILENTGVVHFRMEGRRVIVGK